MTIPTNLEEAYERWHRNGRTPQRAYSWSWQSWEKHFNGTVDGVNMKQVLDEVQDEPIDRKRVTVLSQEVESPRDAVRAFVAAMIWGYGQVGYGPWRTKRIFHENDDAVAQLLRTAEIAQTNGGLAAYTHIYEQRKEPGGYLKYLGPAFGTKYIYFLTRATDGVETTPVLDSIVETWFVQNDPATDLNATWWHPPSYELYLSRLRQWAKELGGDQDNLALDQVEHLIFTPLYEGIDESRAAPLEMLDLLAEDAGALEDKHGPEGSRLVRDLQRWFESTQG